MSAQVMAMAAHDARWSIEVPCGAGCSTVRQFGVALGVQRWHALDLGGVSAQRGAAGRRGGIEAAAVCGAGGVYAPQLGPFERHRQPRGRCERCGWVVALHRGTVEQEIGLYTDGLDSAAAHPQWGSAARLLRRIFTAILADAPPGRDGQVGQRSDLLAHAAVHRQCVAVCSDCAQTSPAAAHGGQGGSCAEPTVVCLACTFTAGSWAGQWEGTVSGECVVAAPCSVLRALAAHYDIAVDTGVC